MHENKGNSHTLFALGASRDFGEKVSQALGIPLSAHEERSFEDGEHKARPIDNVHNSDVFVIHSLYSDHEGSVNDKLCRLLFFIGALKDAGATRVTALVPYLCYGRKDQKTQLHDPVTTRYIAELFEAVGADRVVSLSVHNVAAFQNAFRCPADSLDSLELFVEHFTPLLGDEEVVIVSPDLGGVKRAEQFRQLLSTAIGRPVTTAFLEKYRSMDVVSGEAVVGDLENRVVIIVDDMISTGKTLARAIEASKTSGATRIYAAVSHGLFVGDANLILEDDALTQVVVTDSVPPFRLDTELAGRKVVVLSAAGIFAEAIQQMQRGYSRFTTQRHRQNSSDL